MNFLNKMYQTSNTLLKHDSTTKNPNRVSGGLRAQGVDKVVFVSEDGDEKSVATLKYVNSLEQKIHEQNNKIKRLEIDYKRIVNKLNTLGSQ